MDLLFFQREVNLMILLSIILVGYCDGRIFNLRLCEIVNDGVNRTRLSIQRQKYMQKHKYQQAQKIDLKISLAKKSLLNDKITNLVHSQR